MKGNILAAVCHSGLYGMAQASAAGHCHSGNRDGTDIVIFENCTNLIRTLPALTFDRNNPNDVADTPHELTHAPDALRYFVSGRPSPAVVRTRDEEELGYEKQIENFISY